MRTDDFAYDLPPHLIAQTPVSPRDRARLLVVDRRTGALTHLRFADLASMLEPGDLLVANDTRVLPARLLGRRAETGGQVELLLLRRLAPGEWEALARPARRLRPGERLVFGGRGSGAGGRGSGAGDRPCNGFVVGASAPGSLSDDRGLGAGDRPCNRDDGVLEAVVVAAADDGTRVIRFSDERLLASLGRTPLPPYIRAPLADPERYQTVYGIGEGSAAAPTAGLHFTPELLDRLRERGVGFTTLTLHVGLDTFRPVDEADPREHRIHQEYAAVPAETVAAIGAARAAGRRAIAVGTTTVRAIETAARQPMAPFEGWTDLFVLPGFSFRAVDALITNFHLPRSTLLMLVAAFAGKELIDRAYAEAIRQEYRFYSFGDAMLIL